MVLGVWTMKETYREMKTVRFYKDILCEFTLTFMLMFAVMMSLMQFPERPANLHVANIIGFYVMALIEGWANVQLCVMNPNFCIMFALNKTMSIPKGIFYCIAEMAASLCATLMIYNITPEYAKDNLVASGPREGVSTVANWFSEAIAVAYLVSVVLGSGDGDRKRVMLPNLAIGFAVVSVCVVGAPWGVSLNPSVALGLAFITGDWSNYWVYPTSGAAGVIVALIMYHFLAFDRGVFGGTKAALERFPSMNMSISRSASISPSQVDAPAVIARMESIIDALERENQTDLQNSSFKPYGLQNGYQIDPRITDVRL